MFVVIVFLVFVDHLDCFVDLFSTFTFTTLRFTVQVTLEVTSKTQQLEFYFGASIRFLLFRLKNVGVLV